MTSELKQRGYQVYEASVSCGQDTVCAIVKKGTAKYLAVKGAKADLFKGMQDGNVLICDLIPENAQALHVLFPYTKPCRLPKKGISIGLGDRLGISTPGHIQALETTGVFPIFAQQSIRELNLTNRTFYDVIAAATFGVFEKGYTGGYAADGDHLKTIPEIEYALSAGFTLITLDCSEHISAKHLEAAEDAVEKEYLLLPEDVRAYYETKYLGADFPVVGTYTETELRRLVLTFHKAICHVEDCWAFINKTAPGEVDIELSIDETPMSTSPKAHFLIANEMAAKEISLWSCAPRFYGKFEKGIDYIGELELFDADFAQHQKIAQQFGYKLSVHSGSDKFSIYPIVSRYALGNIHVKTSGTSWLETLRLVAMENPALFERAYQYARTCFLEAKKYYVITTNEEDIPALEGEDMVQYLDQTAARQMLHITYGQLITQPWFFSGMLETVRNGEEKYYACLEKHIFRHIAPFINGTK